MKKLFFVIFFSFLSVYLFTSNINDIINDSINKSKSLLSKKIDIDIAELQKKSAFGDLILPSISFSGSYGLSSGINDEINDSASISFSLSKTIFNGFKLNNNYKLKGLSYNEKIRVYNSEVLSLKYKILTLYYNILLANMNLNIIQEKYNLVKKKKEIAEVSYKRASLSAIELKKVEIQENQILIQLEKAKNTLKNLTNELSLYTPLEIDLNENFLTITNYFNDLDKNLIIQAYKKSSSIKNIEYNLKVAEINVDNAYWNFYPSVSVSASYRINLIKDNPNQNATSWNIGIGLSLKLDNFIPISSGFISYNEQKDNIRKLLITLEDEKNNALNTAFQMINKLEEINLSIDLEKKNVDLYYDLYKLEKERKNISFTDDKEAEIAYLESLYNYYSILFEKAKIIWNIYLVDEYDTLKI